MHTETKQRDNSSIVVNPLQVKKEIKLHCKHCDEPLMQVVVMERPNTEQLSWDILAHCFACGSRSIVHKIVGQYAHCGIFKGEQEITSITEINIENDVVEFTIKKVEHEKEN